jgi:hypothetical protein
MFCSNILERVLQRASAGLHCPGSLRAFTTTAPFSSQRTTAVRPGIDLPRSIGLMMRAYSHRYRSAEAQEPGLSGSDRVDQDPLWRAVALELVKSNAERQALEARLQATSDVRPKQTRGRSI